MYKRQLLALVLSGCAGGASGSGEAAAAAVPAEITESSLNETGEEEEPHPGTEADEETEKQQRTDTAGGETDVRETDVRAMDTDGIQVTAENSTVVRDVYKRQAFAFLRQVLRGIRQRLSQVPVM